MPIRILKHYKTAKGITFKISGPLQGGGKNTKASISGAKAKGGGNAKKGG